MTVPFGIGVGDFIAVLKLVWEVQEAFRDTVGSVDQYRTILETVGSYEHSIITCRHLATQWTSELLCSRRPDGKVDLSCGDQALVNGICYMLKKSEEAIDRFLKENKKYTDSFIKARGSHSMCAQWRKVKFVFRRSEVDKLEANVKEYAKSLQSYTITLAMRVLMKTNQGTTEDQQATMQLLKATESGIDQIHRLLMYLQKDFSSMIRIIQRDLPEMLGYPWSRAGFAPDEKPVLLRDALGRSVHLPFLLCTNHSQFSCLMRVLFDGLPGAAEVSRDDYTLHREKDRATIKWESWEDNLKAGDSLTMSVIIREAYGTGAKSRMYTCTRCRLKNIPVTTFQCPKCLRDSRIVEAERIIPLSSHPTPIPQKARRISSERHSPCKRLSGKLKHTPRNTEKDALQRITLIKEFIKPSWEIRNDANSYFHYTFAPSPLHIAVLSGNVLELQRLVRVEVGMLNELLEQRDYYSIHDDSTRRGLTPLQYAVRDGRSDMIEVLLEAGADIDAVAHADATTESSLTRHRVRPLSVNFTALTLAFERGRPEIAEMLLYYGARNCIGEHVESAMEFAIRAANMEFLEILIQAGTGINGELPRESPPLSIAVSCGNIEAVNRLVAAGADVNRCDKRGTTLLQLACSRNNEEMVYVLLQSGAKVLLKGKDLGYGATPFQVAAHFGSLNLVKILLEAVSSFDSEFLQGPGTNHMLCYAVGSGNVELVQYLIGSGARVCETSSVFETQSPLVIAACNSDLQMVRALLRHGANPNQVTSIGGYNITALVAAKIPAVIRELLDAGADTSGEMQGHHNKSINLRMSKRLSELLDGLLRPPTIHGLI